MAIITSPVRFEPYCDLCSYEGCPGAKASMKEDPRGTYVRWEDVIPMICDCEAGGYPNKPKQHSVDPHAKNCRVYWISK